jgi:succinate dehydrogenase / fumarate reductase, membrane anchor subunit
MVNRVVVGAHYGVGSWLAQRITAVIMAIYTVILLVVFMSRRPVEYDAWRQLFGHGWMRVATLLFAVSLGWHAWVGMRDIFMDYVKHDGLRLTLQVITIVAIALYLGWAVQILWR